MTSRYAVLCALMLAVAGVAHAEDASNWYVAPMLTFAKLDTKRCTDDALGGTVGIGRHQAGWNYELEYTYLPTQGDCVGRTPINAASDAKLAGIEIVAMRPLFPEDTSWVGNLQGLGGVGALKRSGMPKLPGAQSNMIFDLGVAYLQQGLNLFGQDFALRADTRARYQSEGQGKQYGTKSAFYDYVLNVGVVIPFWGTAPVAPAPELVAVVPAAEPVALPDPVVVAPVEPVPAPVEAPPAEPAAPPTIETAKAGDTIVLNGVNFETAKAKLTRNAKTILDGVAKDLNARPEIKVEIGGHTDGRGSIPYNQGLSERRAQSVLAYLVSQGVAAERLSSVGYGPKQPIDSNETDEGRERNRRVELKIQ